MYVFLYGIRNRLFLYGGYTVVKMHVNVSLVLKCMCFYMVFVLDFDYAVESMYFYMLSVTKSYYTVAIR